MENWLSKLRRSKGGPASESEGRDKASLGVIGNVSSDTERVLVEDYGGGNQTRVTHPYVSARSWVRVMPERGTAAVVGRRADTTEQEISYYWSGFPEDRISNYRRGTGYYRPLDLGEFEFSSYGLAQVWGSRRGTLDLRGGITRGWLNHDKLEVGFKAPTHTRQQHDHSVDELRGEERFGVVHRKGEDHTVRSYPKKEGVNAREYMRVLTGGGNVRTLCDFREGHVFDFDGEEIESPIGTTLRRYGRWYDEEGLPITYYMDEQTNVWWIHSEMATTGYTHQVPTGTFRVEAGEKIQIGAGSDVELTGQEMVIRSRGSLYIEATVSIALETKGTIALRGSNITLNDRVVLVGSQPI